MSIGWFEGQRPPVDWGPALGLRRATIERRVRAFDRRSCESSFPGDGLRRGGEGVAKSGDGVMESRSGRAGGDAEGLGNLDQRQPEVVVQDEDRALLDRQLPERPLELVAIEDR